MPKKTRKRTVSKATRRKRRATGMAEYRPRKSGLVGSSVARRDRRYRALKPGRRVSETGQVYYERRRNRADVGPLL